MSSLFLVDNKGIEKADGVNKNVVRSMRYKEYVDVLLNRGLVSHKCYDVLVMMFTKFICRVLLISVIFLMIVFSIQYDDGVSISYQIACIK